jgi:HEAT repeat protein
MKRWLALVLVAGCVADPQDPKTWVKQLGDVREGKNALHQLVRLKNPEAVEPLIAFYRKGKDPEVLKAIATFKDKRQVDVMIEAMDYAEDSCDSAKIASNALGQTPDPKAVDALIAALKKPLSVKSNCNVVKLESMKSLQAIGDKKAVDALVKVLSTPADEQDFYLNLIAARALVKLPDAKAVPALVRGLFMTGRGNDIFQDCRAALLAIGAPSVDPLVEAMERKNKELEADAKKYEFLPGIIVQKTSYVLGDLHDKKAVAPLMAELGKKDEGLAAGPGKGVSGHQSIIIALGQIGDPAASKPLLAYLNDPKGNQKYKAAAAEALAMLGDTSVLPVLKKAADTKFITGREIDPDAAGLAVSGVTAFSRLAQAEHAGTTFQKLPDDLGETDVGNAIMNAQKRLDAAKECKKDQACWAKLLAGKDNIKAEKAAFMLAGMGKAAVPDLAKNVNHADPAVRFAVLFGLARNADKTCGDCKANLEKQITLDDGKKPLKGLVEEMRATLALISNRG